MLKRNGQNLTEYTLIIATVITVFVGMEAFVKRAIQAKNKSAIETAIGYLREATNDPVQWQYEPDQGHFYIADKYSVHNTDAAGGYESQIITKNIIHDVVEREGAFEILPVDPRPEEE